MPGKFRIAVAMAAASLAQPILAAPLEPLGDQAAVGVSGKAYFRLSFGRDHSDVPRVGLKMALSRQDRGLSGFPLSPRRDADAIDLRFTFSGERSLAVVGMPTDELGSSNALDDGPRHSGWRTAAFVAGGLLLTGAVVFAYVAHEADKHSD